MIMNAISGFVIDIITNTDVCLLMSKHLCDVLNANMFNVVIVL